MSELYERSACERNEAPRTSEYELKQLRFALEEC